MSTVEFYRTQSYRDKKPLSEPCHERNWPSTFFVLLARSKAQEFTCLNPTRQVLNKAENGSKSQRLAKGTSRPREIGWSSVGFVVVVKTLLLSLKDPSSPKEQCSQKRRRVFGEG